MLRNMSRTVGSALAALCLVSTLAMAQTQQPPSQAQQPQTPTQSPSQPMTPQHGNTTPQQGHRQEPAQSERQSPSQSQYPTQSEQFQAQPQYPSQPMSPPYGNTTPPQGHRQNAAQDRVMRMICVKDNGKGNCVAARGPDGKDIVVVGEGAKSGADMNCIDRGTRVECDPAS